MQLVKKARRVQLVLLVHRVVQARQALLDLRATREQPARKDS